MYSDFFPSNKKECICGSGMRFERCCGPELTTLFAKAPPAHPTPLNDGSARQRLRRARLKFSHYWILHSAHRVWSLDDDHYAPILDIDLPAMTSLLEEMMYLTHESGDTTFLDNLERLRGAVRDPRWSVRISFLRALTFLYPDWSPAQEERARKEFQAIDIHKVDDAEILQVHFHLFGGALSLSERLWELDRLIQLSTQPSHRLQYHIARAQTLEMHGDFVAARAGVGAAIAEYEATIGDDLYSIRQYGLAMTEALRLGVQQVAEPLEKAQQAFDRLICSGQLNNGGVAEAEFFKGQAYAVAQQWEDALRAYQRSQRIEYHPRIGIFLAEALANLGRRSDARGLLHSIDYEGLSEPLKYDHCLTLALAADTSEGVSVGDGRLLESRLNHLQIPYPVLVDRLRGILSRIEHLRREELEQEIARLRGERAGGGPGLTDDAIRSAVSVHRALPPGRQTLTLPLSQGLQQFLTNITVLVCSQLLDHRQILATGAQSLEDTYTAYVASLLQQRVAEFGWSVVDQRLGGLPSNDGPERGRRDVTLWKGGDAPFGIIEALRASSMGETGAGSVDEHLTRLVTRYDQCGGATLILIVYAEVVNFAEFCDKYVVHFTQRPPTAVPIVEGPKEFVSWKRDGLIRRRLKLLHTVHRTGAESVEVLHVLLHMAAH